MPRSWLLTLALGSLFVAGCVNRSPALADDAKTPTPVLTVEVVKTYPHDKNAFTQGLVFENGALYEGTGLYGASELRRVDLETGRVLQRRPLPATVFGEGLTAFDGRLVQITWTSKTGYVYDPGSFELKGTFGYLTEGWGLTQDGQNLILSDGSPYLYFLDPRTYRPVRRVKVTDAGQEIRNLNELEFIDGQVYANVWMTDRIARIDPKTGAVTAWIDASAIVKSVPQGTPDDVLNGIARNPADGRLYITGKRWPSLFEVKIVPKG